MEWRLGELDEILDYDGVELPALGHQQHGSRKLGTASLSPMSAKNNAFFNTKAETSVPILMNEKNFVFKTKWIQLRIGIIRPVRIEL